MNKRRLIFLSVFGGYHLLTLFFVLLVEAKKNDLSWLLKLHDFISLFKYGTFFGLLLFIIEAIWTWCDAKALDKEREAMRHENNVLKAKVYDLTNQTPTSNKEL